MTEKEKFHFYRKLYKGGPEVSAVGFGAASISGEGGGYGFGNISEEEAIKLLQEAYDKGINLFDTAPIYGFGLSEKRIGKAFKSIREKVVIMSKSGVTWHDNKRVNMTNDPAITQKMLEQSLKDLQSDYIDLYFIHWPDPQVDIRYPLEVLQKAKDEKKILAIGLSNTNASDFFKGREVCDISCLQGEFNLIHNGNKENLFPLCRQNEIGMITWGTFYKGIITGRVDEKRTYDKADARSWAPWWKADKPLEKKKMIDIVSEMIQEEGHEKTEVALGYNLSHVEVISALCGMRNSHQVNSALKSLENLPTPEFLERMENKIKDLLTQKS